MILAACALGAPVCAALGFQSPATAPTDTIRALLLTGEQNHDWTYTSTVHKQTLEATGRFTVDLSTKPAQSLADAKALAGYQVIVLDYNGPRWGSVAEKNFLNAVSDGVGVVVIHASNNAFVSDKPEQNWPEYQKLVGLVWVTNTTGHGKFHAFDVKYTVRNHPITAGLADMKAHPDELYHNLVNTQKSNAIPIATAFSSKESDGTGKDEPVATVGSYGKGRVFHTPLGHVWAKSPEQHASINDPQFKVLLARGTEWAAIGRVSLPSTWTFDQPAASKKDDVRTAPNRLSDDEQAAGWKLLFDGEAATGFRSFKKPTFPDKGWEVTEGTLHVKAQGGGGDIVTRDEYENFEFACDWKVAPGANSGIIYLATEEGFEYPWQTGPEMQILDNSKHADGKSPLTSAGSLYALIACPKDVSKPVGEWNSARVLKKGNHVEHWLNGVKVVEYELGSPEIKKLIEGSKFKAMPAFMTKAKGRIALQEHGDDVWFRSIKVRELK